MTRKSPSTATSAKRSGGALPNSARPEHWATASAAGKVAHLDIPPDAERERDFEIFCSLQVKHLGRGDATHAMRVLVNGAQQWAREVATHDGPSDTLDLRLRRTVPVGQPLRITALGSVQGSAPLGLSITAEED